MPADIHRFEISLPGSDARRFPTMLGPRRDRSVLEAPFLPLTNLGRAIQPVNPAFGRFVERFALAAQAIGEARLASHVPQLLRILEDAGFNAYARESLRHRLLAGHIPVSIDRLLDAVAASYRENVKLGFIRLDDPVGSVLCGIVADAQMAFAGGDGPARKRFWTERDSLADLADLLPEGSEDIGRPEGEARRYATCASLTRLVVASGRPRSDDSSYAGYMFNRVNGGGDDVRAIELTYQGDRRQGYRGNELTTGSFVTQRPEFDPRPRSEVGYRDTIDEVLPNGFFENVVPNTLDKNVFTFGMAVSNELGDQINRLLDDNRERIRKALDDLARNAGEGAKAMVEGKSLPLGDLTKKVTEKSIQAVGNKTLDFLFSLFQKSEHPSYVIAEDVIYVPPFPPFASRQVTASAGDILLYPTRANGQGGVELAEDQDGAPVYGPFTDQRVEFLRQGRVSLGPRRDPANPVPDGLWPAVAAKGLVAAEWAPAAATNGLDILVAMPELNPPVFGPPGSYVWALQAGVVESPRSA